MSPKLSNRDIQILVGLYLAKFDVSGLECLGFASFTEAFNTLGYALEARPASLKNYRDEFDPYFPNARKGWHKRSLRAYCKAVMDQFGNLPLTEFAALVSSVLMSPENLAATEPIIADEGDENSTFAKRLITGRASENFFREVFATIKIFDAYSLVDTTQIGCGFDFKLEPKIEAPFLAVEVKGLRENKGTISLTSKEYRVAEKLRARYFVFVARNFADIPCFSLFKDPLGGSLSLIRRETKIVRIDWFASVST